MIAGAATGDQSGFSVSDAGDINGDGCDDVIIGAPFADSNDIKDSGASYVIFGNADGIGDISLASLEYLGTSHYGFRRTIDSNSKRILTVDLNNKTIDLSAESYHDSDFKGADIINMGGKRNTLKLTPSNVSNITTDNPLIIKGQFGDKLLLANDPDASTFWKKLCSKIYQNGQSTVEIYGDIDVRVAPEIMLTAGYIYRDELTLNDNYVVARYTIPDPNSTVQLEGEMQYSLVKNEPAYCDETTEYESFLYGSQAALVKNGNPNGYIVFHNQGNADELEEIKLTVTALGYADPNSSVSVKPLIMKKAIASGNTHKSISKEEGAEGAIAFTYNKLSPISDRSKESKADTDAHYLKLEEGKFNGLEQFTIQIDFELDFELGYSTTDTGDKRDKNCHHMKQAYLLSLGYDPDDDLDDDSNNYNSVRDNILSVYLKDQDITDDSQCKSYKDWGLSIVLEGSDRDHYIFEKTPWIRQKERVILTIAADLENQEIKVYEKDATHPDGHMEVKDSRYTTKDDLWPTNVNNLRVSDGRAIFGNDIDADEGSLNKRQAFEGRLYSLRVYNKMLNPTQIDTDGDRYLHYSVSSDNVVTDED
jgi:hypothetical protein